MPPSQRTDRPARASQRGQRPSGASETGTIRKRWKNRFPIALLFPNRYSIGMSNLGFQLIYGLLNRRDELVAERFFLPEERSAEPRSVESSRPLTDFPVLLVSISFEQDYPNLVGMLIKGGIEPLAAERNTGKANSHTDGRRPLIIAGGVAAFINPEPLAPFVDLFVIGEAEPVLPAIIDALLADFPCRDREALLFQLNSSLPGCYAPRFYQPLYTKNNQLEGYQVNEGLPKRIRRVVMNEVPAVSPHSVLLSPDAEFADMQLTELGRGCSRGCRFCAAGFVYRPPRLWPSASIIKGLAERPEHCHRVGLLGMEMSRPEELAAIAEHLLQDSCSLSFSSLRANLISPPLLELLSRSGLRSVAIAPDGGSERLRRVINKGITEDEILTAAESLVQAGIMHLKLYFMIGLPTETSDDLAELVRLTMLIRERIFPLGRQRGRLCEMSLSVNCFIPKPWTPFQYFPFAGGGAEPVAELQQKIKFLQRSLAKTPNIRIKADRPANASYQALLARGDRRVGEALLQIVRTGRNWRQVLRKNNIQLEDYIGRELRPEEVFPWEIIDHGIDRDYLWAEYRKALTEKTTAPCDTKHCRRCGVCND